MKTRRSPQRTVAFALAALASALVPWTGAYAAAEGATIDKTGWWNQANVSTSTPAGPVTVPPPPGIPAGDLVVGAADTRADADPTAILAVGIQPDDGPGATVRSFTMQLVEDPDARGNQGTGGAALLACPITDFWVGGENSEWPSRPTYDCEAASAPGVRDDDGTWTFDLAAIGTVWFDTFGTIRADGVVVVPDFAETAPFQAVFKGGDDITVDLESDPAPSDGENPFETPTTFADPPADAGFGNSGSGGGGIFSPPVVTSPPTTLSSPTPDLPDDTGGETAAPPVIDASDTQPAVSRAGDLFGNLPLIVVLAIPLLLGMLLVISYWFGAAGQPVTTIRQRGVSRALEARARATKGL